MRNIVLGRDVTSITRLSRKSLEVEGDYKKRLKPYITIKEGVHIPPAALASFFF